MCMVDIDVAKWAITSERLCRDGDFDFNTRDEIDGGGLPSAIVEREYKETEER